MIIFPMMAAIKSGDGVHYRYPVTIRFMKLAGVDLVVMDGIRALAGTS